MARSRPASPVPSLRRSARRLGRAVLATALLAGAATVGPAQAQRPPATPTPRAAPPPSDTLPILARPVKPTKAFFMSLAVPGWGQARLDRKLTGALFVAFEGISLGMTMKTVRELKFLSRTSADSTLLNAKRQQRQDWLILLGFNHLFSGLEAYVSSQLHDFPADVQLRVLPGEVGAQISVPFRIR
jgi:hypothetical protein